MGCVRATLCAMPLLAASAVAAGPPLTFTRHDVTSRNPGQLSEGFDVGDLDGAGRPDMISHDCAQAIGALAGATRPRHR